MKFQIKNEINNFSVLFLRSFSIITIKNTIIDSIDLRKMRKSGHELCRIKIYENKVLRIGLRAIRLVLLSLQIIVLPNAGTLLLLFVACFGDECANERLGLLHLTTPLRCIALFNTDNGSNFDFVTRTDEQSPKTCNASKSSEN